MDYLEKKLEEINAKDISKSEKFNEAKKLFKNMMNLRSKLYSTQNRRVIILFITFITYVGIASIIAALNKDLGHMVYYLFYEILITCGIITFICYINKKRRERYWKNILQQKNPNLQKLYKDLYNNVANDSKIIKNQISKTVFQILLILFLPMISSYFLEFQLESVSSFIFLACIIILITSIKKIYKMIKEYKPLYRKEVVSKFIKNVNHNMEYNESEISKENIKSDYCYINFDNANDWELKAKIKDYFCENIDGINVEMANVFSYKFYNNSGAILPLFAGTFMVLNTSQKYERFDIRLNKFKLFNKKSIHQQNKKFDRYFEVYSFDDVDIQEALPNHLREFLTNFREKYAIDFEIIFDDKIYIRFYTGNMFKPLIMKKITNDYSTYKFYVITKFAKELIRILST